MNSALNNTSAEEQYVDGANSAKGEELTRSRPRLILPSEPRILRLSTDFVERSARLPYWIDVISKSLFGCTTSSLEKKNFFCHLEIARLDAVQISRAVGSRRSTFRTQEGLASANDFTFHLAVSYYSPWTFIWRGAAFTANPGDIVVTDSRYLFSGHWSDDRAITHIKLPPAWISTWLRDPERFAGRVIPHNVGWGAALSAFVAQLSPEMVVRSPLPQRLMADHLGSLLALVEREMSGHPDKHRVQHRQILELATEIIRQRAGEHNLTAAEVANALKISERALHRSLASGGETFHGLLLRCRNEIAKRMLESTNFNRLTTAEIGRRAGFADPSYFVRAITRYVGTTPRRYRIEFKR
jgi:AraC family transcriptional activator of tynA and feaB